MIVLGAIYGLHGTRNNDFKPQNEFKLDNWVHLGVFSINKAVLYLVLAAIATCVSMIYIARRMQQRPNKVQAAVELLYELMRDNITAQRDDREDGRASGSRSSARCSCSSCSRTSSATSRCRRTPSTRSTCSGLHIPSFSLYAADRQPLDPARARARRVRLLHLRRRPRQGPDRLPQRACSRAASKAAWPSSIFLLEVLSNFMRLLSLTIRLFANILAGHLIILFMAGALAVILGHHRARLVHAPVRGRCCSLFEVGLVAALQAFIFATLTAIYLGGAVAEAPLKEPISRAHSC